MEKRFVSAIDIGTNSFHLIVVEGDDEGNFKIIDREREVIRLGSEQENFITSAEIKKAIKILSYFKKISEYYKAHIHAVATSATREAKNKDEFVKQVFNATGILIEIIEGKKEAGYIYNGAAKALSLNDKRALCIDIGGGSTEIVYSVNNKIEFAESIKVGAVRLTRRFFPGSILSAGAIEECRSYINVQFNQNGSLNFNADFQIVAGTSGTIQSAAVMINWMEKNKEPKRLNGYTFSVGKLNKLAGIILKAETPEERLMLKGMEPKRAEIFPAGILILQKAAELFGIEDFTVSEYALREGIILKNLTAPVS